MTYKFLLFCFLLCVALQVEAQRGGVAPTNTIPSYLGTSGHDGGSGFYDRGDDYNGFDNNNRRPGIFRESVKAFAPFFNDAMVDTFWKEFKCLDAKLENKDDGSDHIIFNCESEKKYLYLLKAMAGDSFDVLEESKYIISDASSNIKTAQLKCKVRSAKAVGYLNVLFTIGNDHKITLKQMNFFPFDHSSNDFVYNLCVKELSLINAQHIEAVTDTILRYADDDKNENIKAIRKRLINIKLPVNSLFTYRLFMEKDEIWVMGVFDIDNTNEHLDIAYKLINKNFKPAFIEILRN